MCCAPGAWPAIHSSGSRTSTRTASAGTSAAGTCGIGSLASTAAPSTGRLSPGQACPAQGTSAPLPPKITLCTNWRTHGKYEAARRRRRLDRRAAPATVAETAVRGPPCGGAPSSAGGQSDAPGELGPGFARRPGRGLHRPGNLALLDAVEALITHPDVGTFAKATQQRGQIGGQN